MSRIASDIVKNALYLSGCRFPKFSPLGATLQVRNIHFRSSSKGKLEPIPTHFSCLLIDPIIFESLWRLWGFVMEP